MVLAGLTGDECQHRQPDMVQDIRNDNYGDALADGIAEAFVEWTRGG